MCEISKQFKSILNVLLCCIYCVCLFVYFRMKLKEISRSAIQSWSPAQHHPVYLATGTDLQHQPSSLCSNATLGGAREASILN